MAHKPINPRIAEVEAILGVRWNCCWRIAKHYGVYRSTLLEMSDDELFEVRRWFRERYKARSTETVRTRPLTYKGVTKTVEDWAVVLKIPHRVLIARMYVDGDETALARSLEGDVQTVHRVRYPNPESVAVLVRKASGRLGYNKTVLREIAKRSGLTLRKFLLRDFDFQKEAVRAYMNRVKPPTVKTRRPLRYERLVEYEGQTKTIEAWASLFGISKDSLFVRLYQSVKIGGTHQQVIRRCFETMYKKAGRRE